MWYGVLADLVVAIHVGYVSYVVVGQLAIWLGLLLRCRWARNFWFRASHLFAIAVVALEAAFQIECPLTRWEAQLRELAGQAVQQGSFMGRLMHNTIFFDDLPPIAFLLMHIGFAVLVLGTFVAFPPRRPKWWTSRPHTA